MKKLYIENFRSIKKCNIGSINNQLAFIGENSTGKSTVCAAILTFWGEFTSSPNDCHYDEESFRIGLCIPYTDDVLLAIVNFLNDTPTRKYTQVYKKQCKKKFKERYKLKENNLNVVYEYTKPSGIGSYYFSNPTFKARGKVIPKEFIAMIKPIIAYLPDERQFYQEHNVQKQTITDSLISIILKKIDFQKGEQNPSHKSFEEMTIDEIQWGLSKKISQNAKLLQQEVNMIFTANNDDPSLEVRWNFHPNILQSLDIKTIFRFIHHEKDVDFFSVGSGTRSIYILSLLQKYVEIIGENDKQVLFILEEPELYLYPKLQKIMADIINKLSDKNQVLLTTHSSTIINACNQEAIYKVAVTENSAKKRTSNYQKMQDVSEIMDMLGYDASNLLNKDYVIFVEGKDDRQQYGSVVKKIMGKDKFKKTLFIEMKSVNNVEVALNIQFLAATSLKDNFMMIIDADGMEQEQRLTKIIKQLQDNHKHLCVSWREKIFVTEYSILEAYGYEYEENSGFLENYQNFLKINSELIEECIKCPRKKLSESQKNEYLTIITQNSDLSESFDAFVKYGINKKVANQYKTMFNIKELGMLNSEEIRKKAPLLVSRIEDFYK